MQLLPEAGCRAEEAQTAALSNAEEHEPLYPASEDLNFAEAASSTAGADGARCGDLPLPGWRSVDDVRSDGALTREDESTVLPTLAMRLMVTGNSSAVCWGDFLLNSGN